MDVFRCCTSVVIMALFFAGSALPAETQLLVVGESFPPYEYVENGKAVGIDIDIITHIFGKMQVSFRVRILPWTRAWEMIEHGAADAVLSTSRKDERESYLYYPKVDMWVSEYVFFTRKQPVSASVHGYEDAIQENLKIGIIRGNSYDPGFWAAFPAQPDGSLNRQLDQGVNVEMNFRKLIGGRIDLYILDKTVGLHSARLLNIQDKVRYHPTVLFSKGYPMPFSRNSKVPDIRTVAERFEQELVRMKRSGAYQKIIDQWTGVHR